MGGERCSESQARRLDGTTGVLLTHRGDAAAAVRRIREMTCMLEQGSIGLSKAAGELLCSNIMWRGQISSPVAP